MPAQAGIQIAAKGRLDARFRGHDSPTLKRRNEKPFKLLKTNDSAKSLIQRS
jgi:hypothetical protein